MRRGQHTTVGSRREGPRRSASSRAPWAARAVAFVALLGAVAVAGPFGPAGTAGAEEPGAETAEDEDVFRFFTDPRGRIPTLRLTISEADCDRLRAEPRTWVKASLREGDKTVHEDVGVHLKGSVGSSRPLDDKPGFTVRMTKFVKGRRFHGLTKFYLNNSVQDPTYLNEFVASEVFRAAGIPVPFVTHARVWLNGRDLGTYVLKEGFDDRFLRRAFRDPAGNLYDGGFCTDVDSPLEKDEGKDPEDRSDLESLLGACQMTDPVRAKEAIAAHLNVEAFLTLAALERMLGHWDGYCMNRNNYRLYVPRDGKAVFIPHGADQLFQDPRAPILDEPVSIVASAVLKQAEWQAAYRQRIKDLLPLFTRPDRVLKRVDEEMRRCSGVLGGAAASPQAGAIRSRIAARAKNLAEQAALPAPKPLELDPGESFRVTGWRPVSEAGGARLEQVVFASERVLRIRAGEAGPSAGSWRARVLLAPGRYRFEATAQADDVVAATGETPGGFGVRATGAPAGDRLSGSTGWKPLRAEFDVPETRNVELSLELLATGGSAVVRLGSLRLVRVK